MKRWARRTELFLGILMALLAMVFTVANPKFATIGNLFDLVKSYSFLGFSRWVLW